MQKQILIISTLDTKGVETFYLKEKIEALGFSAMLMDLSMRANVKLPAEISNAQVAEAGGSDIEEIGQSRERSKITKIMTSGASSLARQYYKEGKVDGVIAMGGSTGTLMASDVMRSLPFGVPKTVISSTAALPGLSTRYIGTGDITLFHSVVEISGLSNLLKNVIDRAAHAITAMVHETITPLVAGGGKSHRPNHAGPL